MDDEFMYVGNYREMRRYSHDSIEKIVEKHRMLFPYITIYLHEAGIFGKKIVFKPGNQYKGFMEEHPELKAKVMTS